MSEINEEKQRQVVPRWRSFAAASHFGELGPLHRREPGAFTVDMLAPVLEDWRREPGLSVAADVVSAAFSIGLGSAARDAAEFILATPDAPPTAVEIAKMCLGHRTPQSKGYSMDPSDQDAIRNEIHSSRIRLREYPNNSVRWADLALLFTMLDQPKPAQRAMRVAIQLAPANRFVVRAASRLYLHQDDPEQAHRVLLNAPNLNQDPWLLAGEIAVAQVAHHASRSIKRARRLIEVGDSEPFHQSELAAALATLEHEAGAVRKCKLLCRVALADPAENALAQVAWLSKDPAIPFQPPVTSRIESNEANARIAVFDSRFSRALDEAKRWQLDQPFSSRPAVFGSYIASTCLENFQEAEQVLHLGLLCNSEEATLHNNLAFVLAKQDRLDEAKAELMIGFSHIDKGPNGNSQRICLTATKGLIAFREGQTQLGRQLYALAIAQARLDELSPLREIAKIYLAIEELRIGSLHATAALSAAMNAASNLADPLGSVFIQKLQRAETEARKTLPTT